MITTELKNVKVHHEFYYKGLAFKRGMVWIKESDKVQFFRETENGNKYFYMDAKTLVKAKNENLRKGVN